MSKHIYYNSEPMPEGTSLKVIRRGVINIESVIRAYPAEGEPYVVALYADRGLACRAAIELNLENPK